MECQNNASKICKALMLGAAIGGVLGVLYAPAKGSELRRKLMCRKEETNELTDALEQKFNDLMKELKRDIENNKSRSSDLA